MANPVAENLALVNALLGIGTQIFGGGNTSQTSTATTSGGNRTQTESGGTTTQSGGTQTTSGGDYQMSERLNISKEGIDQMLRELMEDDSTGFARVASGQKLAGLYNSTSRNMLLNDLLTRSAGQVAKLTAEKVTTKTNTTPQVITTSPKTTTTPDKVTKVQEDPKTTTTETTKDGGNGIFDTDNGKLLGTILAGSAIYKGLGGAAGIASGAKDLYSLLTGGSEGTALGSALAQFPELALTPSGTDYGFSGGLFPDEVLSGIPGDPNFMGPLPEDFSSYVGDINLGNDTAALGIDQVGAMDAGGAAAATVGADLGATAATSMFDATGQVAAQQVAGNSVLSMLGPAMMVLNSGAIMDTVGTIGHGISDKVLSPVMEGVGNTIDSVVSPVQDFIGNLFGWGGGSETGVYEGYGSIWDPDSENFIGQDYINTYGYRRDGLNGTFDNTSVG